MWCRTRSKTQPQDLVSLSVIVFFSPFMKMDVSRLEQTEVNTWSCRPAGSAFGHFTWSGPRAPSGHLELQLVSLTGGGRSAGPEPCSLTHIHTNTTLPNGASHQITVIETTKIPGAATISRGINKLIDRQIICCYFIMDSLFGLFFN